MARGAETGQQAETQSQVDYHRRKTDRRPLVFQGSSQSSYNDSSSLHGRLLLLLRLALPLCSPRPHREFAVVTTTPTFLPSALSHLRGYVHCVSV